MTDSLSDLSVEQSSGSQRVAAPSNHSSVEPESDQATQISQNPLPAFPEVTKAGIERGELGESGVGGSAEISPDELTVISPTQDFENVKSDVTSLEGKLVGHFELKQFLGGGGMGIVFRAFDSVLSRSVAIKLLPRGGTKTETIQRFQVEARSAARLDHPNIARVFQVGSDESCDYIIFEYVEGDNLSQLVRRIGPLPFDLALRYTFQLAMAIQHAYQRGVVHRDIKPANVVVTDGGKLKLIDLGLARSPKANESDNSLTATGVMLGTYDYLSPEQAKDSRSADVRSDLYSLGCTVFFMLTGQPPYPQGTPIEKIIQHSSEKRPRPSAYRADLPSGFDLVTSKLLAIDPADRYQRPAELIADIQELASKNNIPLLGYDDNVVVKKIITRPSWTMQLVPVLVPVVLLLGFVAYLEWGGTRTGNRMVGVAPITNGSSEQELMQKQPDRDIGDKNNVSSPDILTKDSSEKTPDPKSKIESSEVPGSSQQKKQATENQEVPNDKLPISEGNQGFITIGAPTNPVSGANDFEDLESALEAVNNDPRLTEIRIYKDLLALDDAISVKVNQSLTISSAGSSESMIVFRPRASSKPGCFRVRGGNIEFRNLHFRLETSKEMQQSTESTSTNVPTLIEMEAISTAIFADCSLTIDNFDDEGVKILPEARFISMSPPRKNAAMFDIQPKEAASYKPSVTLRNCCIRGEASFLYLTESFPLTISLSNGLCVTDGRVFELGPPKSSPEFSGQNEIEIYLNRFTAISSLGFVRMDSGVFDKPVPLRIVAKQSIFNYGNGISFVQHENLSQDVSKNKLLIFKCEDSFFPQKNPLWLIRYRNPAVDSEEKLGFDDMGDWLDVTGTVGDTTQVTWQSFEGLAIPPSEHTVFDYKLSGPFEKNPAVRREAGLNTEGFAPIPTADFE